MVRNVGLSEYRQLHQVIDALGADDDEESKRKTTSASGERILFLGLQGVLYSADTSNYLPGSTEWRQEMRAQAGRVVFRHNTLNLMTELVEQGGCRIVLFTDWQRVFNDSAKLCLWVSERGLPTDWFHPVPTLPRKPGAEEIAGLELWLQEHGPVSWAVLSRWPVFDCKSREKRVVVVDSCAGLTRTHISQVKRIWENAGV